MPQGDLEPTDHQRVLQVVGTNLAVFLGPVRDRLLAGLAGDQFGALLAEGVDHRDIPKLALGTRTVQVVVVVEPLETPQDALGGAADQQCNIVGRDNPVVADETDDVPVTRLEHECRFVEAVADVTMAPS